MKYAISAESMPCRNAKVAEFYPFIKDLHEYKCEECISNLGAKYFVETIDIDELGDLIEIIRMAEVKNLIFGANSIIICDDWRR